MSHSAVNRAVARLEEDLGIRLLQRTTRSLTLNVYHVPLARIRTPVSRFEAERVL
jgi:Bacterial regulatory helix-turn-helix protein, lysR family